MNNFIEDAKFLWSEITCSKSQNRVMVETDTNSGSSCLKVFIYSSKAVLLSDALPLTEWAKHTF